MHLFNSRLDDNRRGGDFDRYVESRLTDLDRLIRARERFPCLLDVSAELEGEKIDVVLSSPLLADARPIDPVAR